MKKTGSLFSLDQANPKQRCRFSESCFSCPILAEVFSGILLLFVRSAVSRKADFGSRHKSCFLILYLYIWACWNIFFFFCKIFYFVGRPWERYTKRIPTCWFSLHVPTIPGTEPRLQPGAKNSVQVSHASGRNSTFDPSPQPPGVCPRSRLESGVAARKSIWLIRVVMPQVTSTC